MEREDYFSILHKCELEPYEAALRKQDVSMGGFGPAIDQPILLDTAEA